MEKYTEQEIRYNYYHNYKHNLLNVIKLFDYDFIPIKDILLTSDITECWSEWSVDLFLQDVNQDKIKLAKSIIQNGTYWPLQVLQFNNQYYIYEGRHRISSLKLALNECLIDETFEMFSIIVPSKIFYIFEIDYLNYDIEPVELYYNEDFTELKTITKIRDAFFSIQQYPRFLRNWLYKYPNIKPLPLINNKEMWYESINSN